MKLEGKKLTAADGKDLFCKRNGKNYGAKIWLGYVYYKDGKHLDEPYLLTDNDFEEIDHVEKEERRRRVRPSERDAE